MQQLCSNLTVILSKTCASNSRIFIWKEHGFKAGGIHGSHLLNYAGNIQIKQNCHNQLASWCFHLLILFKKHTRCKSWSCLIWHVSYKSFEIHSRTLTWTPSTSDQQPAVMWWLYPSLDNGCYPIWTSPRSGFYEAVMKKMEGPLEQLPDQIDLLVTAIIADAELRWAITIANKRNIPVATPCTVSATVFHCSNSLLA